MFAPHRSPWLLRQPDLDSGARLFCVPYLGTGASAFHAWPRRIGSIEVCPVQLPGRENRRREPSPESYEQLGHDLAETLLPYADRPIGLFGHCASAYIAFEAWEALAGFARHSPTLLVSAMPPPKAASTVSILSRDAGEIPALVAELARARGGEPDPEMLEMTIELFRADLEIYRRYRPRRRPATSRRIDVVAWADDVHVSPPDTHGWDAYGLVRHVTLPGDHWRFLECPDDLQVLISARVQVPVRDATE